MATFLPGFNSRAHDVDSAEPPAPTGLRIYSMRFCPFAERAMLALRVKGIKAEFINLNLKKKPKWFLEKINPLGLVPVLLSQDGKLVYESDICVEYLDSFPNPTGPVKQLLSTDPYKKAQQKMKAARLSGPLMGVLRAFFGEPDKIPEAVNNALTKFDSELTENYLGGADIDYVDVMTWPWIERIALAEAVTGKSFFANYPKVKAYYDRMVARPEIADVVHPLEVHMGYAKSYKTSSDGIPDYNVGISGGA